MNVLCYVQPHRGGGVARHSIEMINGLSRQAGMRCTLFTSRPDASRHAGFFGNFSGMPVVHQPIPGKWLERAWKVVRWPPLTSRCRGFDVLYAPAEVRFPECGIPSIITVHDVQALEEELPWSGTASHRSFRRKWLRWLPQVFSEASRVATVSEFSRRRMVELLGVDPARIVVVGNGVSPAFFRPETPTSAPPQPSVVVIGGLRMKKGAAETLAVARELQRRRSDLVVNVYGHHDPEWANRAAEHANVRLHGYLDDDQLARRLADSTALLFLSPYEGFGIPAVEAMAAGTPAVVANAASLPEVVGEAGIIVDAANPASIADHLESLQSDATLRDRLVTSGRRRAGLFSWDSCVRRLMETLQAVVAGNAAKVPHPLITAT